MSEIIMNENKFGDIAIRPRDGEVVDPDSKEVVTTLGDLKNVCKETGKAVFHGFDEQPLDWLVYFGESKEHGKIWMTPALIKTHPPMNDDGELLDGGIVLLIKDGDRTFLSVDSVPSRHFDANHFCHARNGRGPRSRESPMEAGIRRVNETTGIKLDTREIRPLGTDFKYKQFYAGLKWVVHSTAFFAKIEKPDNIALDLDIVTVPVIDTEPARNWMLVNVTDMNFAIPELARFSGHHKLMALKALLLTSECPSYLKSFQLLPDQF
jgi:hypothetical protein